MRSYRTRACASLVAASLVCAGLAAQAEPLSLFLRPEFGVQAGIETYELALNVGAVEPGTTASASSKLSYPVGTLLAGGTAEVDAGAFSFAATALTNLIDPWGTLTDQDFVSLNSGGVTETVEFSHTDSRTTLRALVLEGVGRYRIADLSRGRHEAPLHLAAGFRYESSVYDAYGASGWQLDENGDQAPVSLDDSVQALHYRVQYLIPFVGAGVNFVPGDRFALGAEARLLVSFSSHDDDHVLRHKAANATAQGAGVAIALEPELVIVRGAVATLSLGLSVQFQYLGALHGRLSQHYYADDPYVAGDQTNTPIPDSDFSFTSLRFRALAFGKVRF